MKIFFTILILIFSLYSLSKAENISKFEIEGISVGESLSNYFSEEEINNAKTHQYRDSIKYPNTKFLIVSVNHSLNLEEYEKLHFVIEKNDKKKIIHSVEGFIYFENNINECPKLKDKIVVQLTDFLKNDNISIYNDDGKHAQDKSGESTVKDTIILFSSGAVFRVMCTDWSKKMQFKDELRVVINSVKFSNYLRSL